jgi:ATP-dependent DNA ligase
MVGYAKASKVPTGPDWLHEVKCDDYRMIVIRKQDREAQPA